MKKYNEFILEISAVSNAYRKIKAKRNEDSTIRDIESNYPGVNQFFAVANKWASDVSRNEDPQLYNLLSRYAKKKGVSDLSDMELRSIYKFIVKRNLRSYEDFEEMFIGASENG